jgi:hypothetical protein
MGVQKMLFLQAALPHCAIGLSCKQVCVVAGTPCHGDCKHLLGMQFAKMIIIKHTHTHQLGTTMCLLRLNIRLSLHIMSSPFLHTMLAHLGHWPSLPSYKW